MAARIDRSKKNIISAVLLHFKGDHVLFTRPFQHCNGTPDSTLHKNTRWLRRSITLRANENFGGKKRLDSRALTLVTTRFHVLRGAELLGPNPKYPLWNPPGRGLQGSAKLDCVTEWTLYRFSSMVINTIIGKRKTLTLHRMQK